MSISKLYNSLNLSQFDDRILNLIFFTSDKKFNIVRSKFNSFAKSNIELYDISDSMAIENEKYQQHICISISDSLLTDSSTFNVSKSSDSRYINSIGWQRHLNHSNSQGYSTGHLRGLGKNMEPIFRDGEHFQFNLDAIRRSDLPLHQYSSPTGLSIEEACQIARYIGTSNNIKSFNLVCTQELITENMAEAMASILWYLFEGLTIPKHHPTTSNEFSEFIVLNQHEEYFFLQSNINGKWWIKVNDNYHPCSFEEYKDFSKGKTSQRLIDIIE